MKVPDQQEKKEKRGLYFALAVCLVAVGIAVWGTYNSVSDYLATNQVVKPSVQAQEDEDPGTSRAAAQQAAAPVPTEEPPEVSTEAPGEAPPTEPASPAPEEAPVDAPVDAPLYTLSDTFVLPVTEGVVNAPFSSALVYNEALRDHRSHWGQDLTAAKGQTVLSANAGLVKKTTTDLLLGNLIQIEHGDYTFWYCGLGDTFLVKEGDTVAAGTPIGSVTTVPSEPLTSHLHLQVEKDSQFIDPATLAFRGTGE